MSAIARIINLGVESLLIGPAPDECSIPMPTSESERLKLQKLREVPEHLRLLLSHVVRARGDINRRDELERVSREYGFGKMHHFITIIENAARILDEQLRLDMSLADNAIIEYHADWRFSVTSLDTERLIWERARAERPEEKTKDVGRRDCSYLERPPERSPVCFHVSKSDEICPHAATLEIAVAQTRAKKKPAA